MVEQPQTKQEPEHDPKASASRNARRDLAAETLAVIEKGRYLHHDLRTSIAASKQNTRYYAPDSLLSTWAAAAPRAQQHPRAKVALLEISTLEGARYIASAHAGATPPPKIGVLNFASAKKPGGGFLNGAQAQEESIARASTLYPTLMTTVAQQFYALHKHDPKGGYYTHAMVYSPGVIVFRDDQGGWLEPLVVDVLTSPAVNAGVVRQSLKGHVAGDAEEARIARTMRERMGRLLFLFESQGVRHVVLGSFGTGVFRNSVTTVASIWADLLLKPESRFARSFDSVVFAVLGKQTFAEFEAVFADVQVER